MKVYFQAGVNLKAIEPNANQTHVVFSAPVGWNWIIEASDSPSTNTTWTEIGAPIVGDDYFHEIIDSQPVQGQRFYRAKGATPP